MEPAPNDPFNLVLFICLVLGSGTLLAYNALVSCAAYFHNQFTAHNDPDIMFLIVPVFSVPNLLCTVLMIPFGSRLSWTFKILGSFTLVAILVVSIPYIVPNGANPLQLARDESFLLFLFIVVAIGVASSVLQCSIIAFCGLLPTRYLQTLMGGQAVSGIVVCVIRICSKLFLPLTPSGH